MTDDKQELQKKIEALPSVAKAFIEGYGVSVGQIPDSPKIEAERMAQLRVPDEGYALNFNAATNRVCLRCGCVVADFDLHDKFHDGLVTKDE